jgi:hypothetical protein
LEPRCIGPFPIIERIGKVAYRLGLPPEFQGIHDVFHVSQQRQYIANPEHVINDEAIDLMLDLSYVERLIQILDYDKKELHQKKIPLLKVL